MSRSAQLDERARLLENKRADLDQRAARLEVRLKKTSAKLAAGWQLQRVIVADRDLKSGEYLSADMVAVSNIPRRFLAESMLTPEDMEVALNREIVSPLKRGELVFWRNLRGIRSLKRLSRHIPKWGRAVTISVTEPSTVGRWVQPSDHVDVLYTFNKATTTTLVEDAVVLATGAQIVRSANTKRPPYRTITLLVLPEEAERLVLAQASGSLYLTLRNAAAKDLEQRKMGTTMRELQSPAVIMRMHKKRLQLLKGLKGRVLRRISK